MSAFGILLVSCKKDDASNNSNTATMQVKFDFNGTTNNYTNGVDADKDSLGLSRTYVDVTASKSSGSLSESIEFTITKNSGTSMVGSHNYNAGVDFYPVFTMTVGSKKYSYVANQNTSTGSRILPASFVIAVSKDDNKVIEGTFSGEMYEIQAGSFGSNIAVSTTKYNVTNGIFNSKYN